MDARDKTAYFLQELATTQNIQVVGSKPKPSNGFKKFVASAVLGFAMMGTLVPMDAHAINIPMTHMATAPIAAVIINSHNSPTHNAPPFATTKVVEYGGTGEKFYNVYEVNSLIEVSPNVNYLKDHYSTCVFWSDTIHKTINFASDKGQESVILKIQEGQNNVNISCQAKDGVETSSYSFKGSTIEQIQAAKQKDKDNLISSLEILAFSLVALGAGAVYSINYFNKKNLKAD